MYEDFLGFKANDQWYGHIHGIVRSNDIILCTRVHLGMRKKFQKGVFIFFAQKSHFPFFWISYADCKLWSKRQAWPFVARGWILQNFCCFFDEMNTFVPKNDIWKKSWANYESPLVQIWPRSYQIERILSIWRGVDRKLLSSNYLVNCTKNVV